MILTHKVKTFMILAHINIDPELLTKLVASKLRMGQIHILRILATTRKIFSFPREVSKVEWEVLGDQWREMASGNSYK